MIKVLFGRARCCVAGKRMAILLVGVSMIAVVGLAGAIPALASETYSATVDALALRSGPGSQYAVVQRVNQGTVLNIECQVQGGTSVGGNATWDRLVGGQLWVADYYTTSPSFNSFAPGLGPCPTAAPSGRSWGATRSYNAGVAGQCTWGAYQQFYQATGAYPALSGNAWQWADSARTTGWTVVLDAQPRSIVVFQPGVQGASSSGHVAWVESVEVRSDGLYVHILEMNGPAGPGQWDRRVLKDVVGMSYILAP